MQAQASLPPIATGPHCYLETSTAKKSAARAIAATIAHTRSGIYLCWEGDVGGWLLGKATLLAADTDTCPLASLAYQTGSQPLPPLSLISCRSAVVAFGASST